MVYYEVEYSYGEISTQTLTNTTEKTYQINNCKATNFSKRIRERKTSSQLIKKPKQALFKQLKEVLTSDILPGDLITNYHVSFEHLLKIKFSPFHGWVSQNGSHRIY